MSLTGLVFGDFIGPILHLKSTRQVCAFVEGGNLMKHFAKVALLLSALVMSTHAFGQATTALTGTVQDPSRALIPGVEVTAVNDATGVETRAISNEAGIYNFAGLQPGTYTVRASLPSFQTRRFTQVALSANQTNRLNFVLELSAQSTAVEVTIAADRLLLESSPSVGDVLTGKEVVALPNVTNNVQKWSTRWRV